MTYPAPIGVLPFAIVVSTRRSASSGAIVALAMFHLACRFDSRGVGASFDATVGDAPAPDPLPIDAAPADAVDAAPCPGECTTCLADGTCQIECGAAECASGVTCPPDRPCVVNCVGDQACEGGPVDCSAATRCQILCAGTDACDEGVTCAGTSCTVTCSGDAACEDKGVDCEAEACQITCDGADACSNHVCCRGAECAASCTDSAGGCCSCGGC